MHKCGHAIHTSASRYRLGGALRKRFGHLRRDSCGGCACVAHAQSTYRDNEKLLRKFMSFFPLTSAIMTTT